MAVIAKIGPGIGLKCPICGLSASKEKPFFSINDDRESEIDKIINVLEKRKFEDLFSSLHKCPDCEVVIRTVFDLDAKYQTTNRDIEMELDNPSNQ